MPPRRGGYSATPGSSGFRTPTPASSRSATPNVRKKRQPSCPECGSKKIKTRDGQFFCERGHVQQGIRIETNDDEGITGGKARHTKKQKIRVLVTNARKDYTKENLYYGPRRRFLHFQCNQLIFRHQIAALRREWPHLPEEFEAIARDVWSIYILNVPEVEATPLLEGREAKIIASRPPEFRARTGYRFRSRSRSVPTPGRNPSIQRQGSEARSTSDPEDLSIINEEEQLLELLSENDKENEGQDDVAQEELQPQDQEDEWEFEEKKKKRVTGRPRKTKHEGPPKSPAVLLRETERYKLLDPFDLDYNIAALYYTLFIARVPVILGDLLELFKTHKLPYLFAAQCLSFEMIERFDDRRRRFYFEREDVPTFEELQPNLRLFSDILSTSEIHLPELNAAPVLWAAVERLGLPPTIYTTARNIIPAIELELKTPLQTASGIRLKSQARCLSLMALVVVVVKMRYGLDGEKRYEPQPLKSGFPIPNASGVPELNLWLDSLDRAEKDYSKEPSFVQESEINLIDVLSQETEDQLDALINYSERVLLPTNYEPIQQLYDNSRRRRDALTMLHTSTATTPSSANPNTSTLPSTISSRHSHVDSQLESLYRNFYSLSLNLETNPISKDSLLAGEAYQVYETSDVLGIEHLQYQRVVRKASKAFGVEPSELIKEIEEVEAKLSTLNRSQSVKR